MPNIRFRVDFSGQCAIGPGKVALLEAIDRCGSLSQAARDLRMSYRRAWLLVEDLNVGFRNPLTAGSAGGRGGGGMHLTDFGRQVVSEYRLLESDIDKCLEARMLSVTTQALESEAEPSKRRGPIPRRARQNVRPSIPVKKHR
jgi:molybdate transport system regulatory protein